MSMIDVILKLVEHENVLQMYDLGPVHMLFSMLFFL